MISEKHSAAARANGALSRGPKTPEGRARSARNALRHGLLANCVLLPGENAETFRSLFDGYIDRFQPQDDAELTLIEQMVSATWRLGRATTIETQMLEVAISAQKPGSPRDRLAAAFGDLAATPKLNLIERYQTRFCLMHSRAIRDLAMMRQKLPQPAPVPNEPTELFLPSPIPNEPSLSAPEPEPVPNEPNGPQPEPNEPKPSPVAPRTGSAPPLSLQSALHSLQPTLPGGTIGRPPS